MTVRHLVPTTSASIDGWRVEPLAIVCARRCAKRVRAKSDGDRSHLNCSLI